MQQSMGSLRQLEHHIDASVRLYRNREADDYPAHWHSSAELIFPMENTYTVMVGDNAYEICPGELFLIPAGVVHEIFAPEQGFRYLFMVDQEELYAIQGLTRYQHLFYPCIHLTEERDAPLLHEVQSDFMRAVHHYNEEDELALASARLSLGMVFVRIAQYLRDAMLDAPDRHHQHRQSGTLVDVCAYISEHCAEQLTLDDMAAYSGYSKYHFARQFKTYTGTSFYDYYMRQRMVLCRRLLADPALTITEAAMQSGFGSIATFNRVFRQYEGTSPTEYRKMQQNQACRGID